MCGITSLEVLPLSPEGAGCPLSCKEYYTYVLMADAVDLHAYWFATEFDEITAIEIGDWRLEEWTDVGDVLMAYRREDGEWRASHYYRPGKLLREGPGAPRHAGDGGDSRD